MHPPTVLEHARSDAAERPGELHPTNFILARGAQGRRLLRVRGLTRPACESGGPASSSPVDLARGARDLWDVDVRRFAPFHANRRYLARPPVETLGLHYAMRGRARSSSRRARCAARPVRPAGGKGACSHQLGWSVRTTSCRRARPSRPNAGAPGWLPHVRRAARMPRARPVFDQTSFGKWC